MLTMIAKGYFTNNPLIFFPVVALGIFIAVFSFVAFRAMTKSNTELQQVASLALHCDDNESPMALQGVPSHE